MINNNTTSPCSLFKYQISIYLYLLLAPPLTAWNVVILYKYGFGFTLYLPPQDRESIYWFSSVT